MTALRVYLLADFGKGPKVVQIGKQAQWTATYRGGVRDDSINERAWWLVEAASAEDARAIIAEYAAIKSPLSGDARWLGILDYGGQPISGPFTNPSEAQSEAIHSAISAFGRKSGGAS